MQHDRAAEELECTGQNRAAEELECTGQNSKLMYLKTQNDTVTE